jgi:hypothetical protein
VRHDEIFIQARGGVVMARVVGVHGIAQEQLGRNQLLDAWRPALADGVLIAGGDGAVAPSLDLAFYGDLFLSAEDEGAAVFKGSIGDKGSIGESWADAAAGLSGRELEFLTAAADEIEVGGEDTPMKGLSAVPALLQPMARRLTRRFDGWLVVLFVAELRQVRLYLQDEDLAEQIRSRVINTIGSGCAVLVGHSLGSVVAFETLAMNPELQVGTLVTVGSPLSMRTIATRLRAGGPASGEGLPGRVGRWVNIYDPSDPVAGAGVASRLWPAAVDFEVNNGDKPHSISRYLSKRASGEAIIAGAAGSE